MNTSSIQANHRKYAYRILQGFDQRLRWFSRITNNAPSLFEKGDWQGMQAAVRERLVIYKQSLADVVAQLFELPVELRNSDAFWHQLKQAYSSLLEGHPQAELAETYYNSIIGKVFNHDVSCIAKLFIQTEHPFVTGKYREKLIHRFDPNTTAAELFDSLFARFRFNIPFEDRQRDIQRLKNALREQLSATQLASVTTLDVLRSIFFRGKAAYIVGRIGLQDQVVPFVVALQTNAKQALYVDALLTENRDISVVFGFARAYFLVDVQYPAELVTYLNELMPHKKRHELYTSIGFHKHGKTEFYRDFLAQLATSTEQFALAPGIKGLVMAVFHLPSFGVVFKVIRDEFAESKRITREHVKRCYKMVKMSDRVGRMADTHEYSNFQFPRARISEELIEELTTTCKNSITLTDDTLTIHHLYIEKRLTPLNLYLQQHTEPEIQLPVIDDLGTCIKQIAQANIFPGDMLHKNFGVTRHGRVVFYDYDEICLMHERDFHELPKDDPFALDSLSVGPTDVFPEQFEYFILAKKQWKEMLKQTHSDLFTAKYWKGLQNSIKQQDSPHFFPFNPAMRFPREDD